MRKKYGLRQFQNHISIILVLINSRTKLRLIWRYRDGLEVVRRLERVLGVSLCCIEFRTARDQQFYFSVEAKSPGSAGLKPKTIVKHIRTEKTFLIFSYLK